MVLQNVCASGDWVVALLPKSVEWIRGFDLGGAGFDGFRDAGKRPAITEFKFVHGGHAAGIGEAHWERIARFIVHGEPFDRKPGDPPGLFDGHANADLVGLANARIGIPAVILAGLLVAWIGFKLGGLLGLLLAVLAIRFVVTRL